MDRTTRAQAAAGGTALVALPALYLGGVYGMAALSAAGMVLFTAAMLVPPVLRILATRSPTGP